MTGRWRGGPPAPCHHGPRFRKGPPGRVRPRASSNGCPREGADPWRPPRQAFSLAGRYNPVTFGGAESGHAFRLPSKSSPYWQSGYSKNGFATQRKGPCTGPFRALSFFRASGGGTPHPERLQKKARFRDRFYIPGSHGPGPRRPAPVLPGGILRPLSRAAGGLSVRNWKRRFVRVPSPNPLRKGLPWDAPPTFR